MVTSKTLHAVLMENSEGSARVLRRFTRQRVSRTSHPGLMTSVPELQESANTGDFTIQFGENADSASQLFLNSEFNGAAPQVEGSEEVGGFSSTFVLELGDILAECRDAGYEEPIVAFCADSSDVTHIELRTLNDGKQAASEEGARAAGGRKIDRSQLLKMLGEQYQGGFDGNRVGFLPMASLDPKELRYLSIFPKQRDSVIATLLAIREAQNARMPTVRIMDAEVPLYVGHALIVRAGTEDTLVLFVRGEELFHYESLRSLTAYESPETICSRVLLQQDEHGISDVQHVFLLSEEREEELIESFEMFFPDAQVDSLRQVVAELGDVGLDEANTSAIVGAVGAALRVTGDPRYDGVFDDINLMPKRLIKRRFRIPLTWHVPVMALFIGLTVLFFSYRFISVEEKIQNTRELLLSYPADIMDADPRALQARIDSFDAVTASYLNALNVLDGLLHGSDQWSRTLEKISQETASVGSIWIDSWRPNGAMLEISGNATSRDRVVELAQRIDGDIEAQMFSEIREWPVFSFRMRVPIVIELPEAAKYLREQVNQIEEPAPNP
jgi:Tfp pilus assembly protein PilN